jgi:hypothetical protein
VRPDRKLHDARVSYPRRHVNGRAHRWLRAARPRTAACKLTYPLTAMFSLL